MGNRELHPEEQQVWRCFCRSVLAYWNWGSQGSWSAVTKEETFEDEIGERVGCCIVQCRKSLTEKPGLTACLRVPVFPGLSPSSPLPAAHHSVPCGSSALLIRQTCGKNWQQRGSQGVTREMAELKFPWDIRQMLHVRHHCCSILSLLQVNVEVEATPPCQMGWLCDLLPNDLGKCHWVLRLSHKKTVRIQHGVLWAEPPRKMSSYHEGAMRERT